LDCTYYSFDYDGHHFVILDSAHRYGWETGAISNEEFTWLKEDLENNADEKIMIETSAVHKYPAGYNIYKVFTNGYMQSFYKVKSELTENRRKKEGEDLLRPLCGRFGFVWDRNFVVKFNDGGNSHVEMIKYRNYYC